jgi:hypothetical protein
MNEDQRDYPIIDDLASGRLGELLERKRQHNEIVLSRLGAFAVSLDAGHNALDKAIKAEISDATSEARSFDEVRERQENAYCKPVRKSELGVAVKILDSVTKTGLPGLMVSIHDPEGGALADGYTDRFGNFAVALPLKRLKALAPKQQTLRLRYRVFAGSKKQPVLDLDRSVTLTPGGINAVKLPVDCAALGLGKAVVGDLRDLNAALSVPVPSSGEPQTAAGPNADGVENIPGVGPARARKLADAGINSVLQFTHASDASLHQILGKVDVAGMKRASLELLKKRAKPPA